MYTYVCLCVHPAHTNRCVMYIQTNGHTHYILCIITCMWLHRCTYMCLYLCTHVRIYIYIYIHICISTYYIYEGMYVYIHKYMHTCHINFLAIVF